MVEEASLTEWEICKLDEEVVECGDINTELGVKESLSDILEIAEE